MEYSPFTNSWNPVQGSCNSQFHRHPEPPSKRKAVRSAAAVEIQRAARGFLARKNMRIVRKVAAELEEIARYIETAGETSHRDTKERLRVAEMLMALLFRLDSVRGVRDCRKKVTCRVIQLQESLESPELIPATRSRVVKVEPKGDQSSGGQQAASVVMERMMAESEQVKGLLTELCERSAEQGQLMRRLVQSVEQLELAVQRIERKGKLQAIERPEEAVNCEPLPKDCSCSVPKGTDGTCRPRWKREFRDCRTWCGRETVLTSCGWWGRLKRFGESA